MSYRAAKISFDGSHYIATPKENFPQGHKRRRASRPLSIEETETKEQFETAYKESQQLPRKERKAFMRKAMEETIPDKEQRQEYIEQQNERKKINAIRRKVRLSKKVNLQREWSYFCTFTFSHEKHTEESFRKSLRNTLKHLVNRKGWKHIGVWERGGETGKKELQIKRRRAEELSRLMQLAYEDRLKGKMPEDICISFIQKYSEEQKKVEAEIAVLEERLTETTNTIQSADEFIRNIKKYLEAPELTREMCYELLDRVVVGGHPKHTGKERVIDIVYKVDIASVLRYKFNNSNK